jgi:hypothetical protein
MFEQVFDSMRKIAEANVQAQQEMFRRWAALWPGLASVPSVPVGSNFTEQAQRFQKKWAATVSELIDRQSKSTQEQFAAGLAQIEQTFKLAEVKDVEVLRAKTLELWQKSFALLRQSFEAQVHDFQAAVAKWVELFNPAP